MDADTMLQQPLVDRSVLDELREMLGAKVAPVLDTFRQQLTETGAQWPKLAAAADWPALRSQAHRFKGAAGAMGATRAMHIASAIERRVMHGDVAGAAELVAHWPAVTRGTMAALN
jgi:HPt (histidine-containing phosphotransfer) domain-containing protein